MVVDVLDDSSRSLRFIEADRAITLRQRASERAWKRGFAIGVVAASTVFGLAAVIRR
ncbi:hypothetical protein [Halomarina rubra]|uniref:Uncharacterized protein n=1 Tax=Halomarina rubra TaxID=2071873 RepID=A0ABD6B2B1_9EURY|nr:hypothetical protein [Halomarina rubra]